MKEMYSGGSPPEDGPYDEAAVVSGLRTGDRASFERMVRHWCGRMLAVARRIVQNEADSLDCVQEAFLQAFRKMPEFRGDSSLGTWLHRIVVNAALMRVRSKAKKQEELPPEDLPAFDSTGHRIGDKGRLPSSVEAEAVRRELQELVRRQIQMLPEQYRVPLLLRDIEGYDTAQVAEMLGLSEGALKVRLHRARAALRARLLPLLKGGDL